MQAASKTSVPKKIPASPEQNQLLPFVSKGDTPRNCRRAENIRCEQKFTRDLSSDSDSDSVAQRRHRRSGKSSASCIRKETPPRCRKPKHNSSSERDSSCERKRDSSCERKRDCSPRRRKEEPVLRDNMLLTWSGGVYTVQEESLLPSSSLTSEQPLLLGNGEYLLAEVDCKGETTNPVQVGSVSKVVPFDGRIKNLEVSMDIFVSSSCESQLSQIAAQYDFTVLISRSPPNTGTDHVTCPYLSVPVTANLKFGAVANNCNLSTSAYRSASGAGSGSYQVYAGDRIAVKVRTNPNYDATVSCIKQLSFQASLVYEKAAC